MGQDSKIEWTHHTFNPWIGCTKVSAGCKNCYAERDMDQRRGRVVWGPNGTRSITSYQYWRKVLLWNQIAGFAGERKRVFCASLADVFEDWDGTILDNQGWKLYWDNTEFDYKSDANTDKLIPFTKLFPKIITNYEQFKPGFWFSLTMDLIRQSLFKLIVMTPHLDWLLLTKRPENIAKMVPPDWMTDGFPGNVWIGTSVEDQESADLRVPILATIPVKIRFLSCEPQLDVVYLGNFLAENKIQWVIQGGESGPGHRFFDIKWAYFIKAQCKTHGVPYFFKQIDKKQPIPEDLMIREFPVIS